MTKDVIHHHAVRMRQMKDIHRKSFANHNQNGGDPGETPDRWSPELWYAVPSNAAGWLWAFTPIKDRRYDIIYFLPPPPMSTHWSSSAPKLYGSYGDGCYGDWTSFSEMANQWWWSSSVIDLRLSRAVRETVKPHRSESQSQLSKHQLKTAHLLSHFSVGL